MGIVAGSGFWGAACVEIVFVDRHEMESWRAPQFILFPLKVQPNTTKHTFSDLDKFLQMEKKAPGFARRCFQAWKLNSSSVNGRKPLIAAGDPAVITSTKSGLV